MCYNNVAGNHKCMTHKYGYKDKAVGPWILR